jgi:NADH-quinone oxidoreductase subunit M
MSVIPLPLPWLELAIVLALVGAVSVSLMRDPMLAWRWGLVFTGGTFVCTLLACLGFYLCRILDITASWNFETRFFGRQFLDVDELNAPLLAVVGVLHFLVPVATARTKMRRFSLGWSMTSQAIRLATFGCTVPSVLIGLLSLGTIPPFVELLNRHRPTRVYALHMSLFVGLMVLGWLFVDPTASRDDQTVLATIPILAAVLIRCGTIPVHCWLTDWFEHASFGNALLFVTPLAGVYAAVRLVLPIAPDWILQSLSLVSLVTAVYAAGMAAVQKEARRFFAYLFVSHASLVLVGLELHTPRSLTGALALWISVSLSLGGFGLMLRALEARFGRLSLADFQGLYNHSPTLAVCFLLTGLCSVGFPGTLGFVAADLLVDGAIEANPYVGVALVVAAAINGIAVVRAYFLLFTGTVRYSTIPLHITLRERIAALTLTALILGGGIMPQPGITSRQRAAEEILHQRQNHARLDEPTSPSLAAQASPKTTDHTVPLPAVQVDDHSSH